MKLLAVDGNWILHRVFYTAKPEFAASRYLTMICKAATEARASSMVVCFDGARNYRKEKHPHYKANRVVRDQGMRPSDLIPSIKSALDKHKIQHFQIEGFEADDLLCSLASTTDCAVLTADKDHRQYLRGGVVLFNPYATDGILWTSHKDIPAKHDGLSVRQLVDYQTLVGDKVDNVEGIMSPRKAVKGLLEHGTLRNWLKAKDGLHLQVEQLRVNRDLVKLDASLEVRVKPQEFVESNTVHYQAWVSSARRKSLF